MGPFEITLIILMLSAAAICIYIFVKTIKPYMKLKKEITTEKEQMETKIQEKDQEQDNQNENKDARPSNNMNYCRICGQPSGIYEICRDCQKDIESGRVKYCDKCNTYYLNGQKCSCESKENTYSYEQPKKKHTEKINVEINNEQTDDFGSSFKKGCGGGCGVVVGIIVAIVVIWIILAATGAVAIDQLLKSLGL